MLLTIEFDRNGILGAIKGDRLPLQPPSAFYHRAMAVDNAKSIYPINSADASANKRIS